MKIDYKIEEVAPKIFAVIIKDKYDRAMTFCRSQEYYECPNRKFRGKDFNIWDYAKWYHTKYGKGFSYGADWSGFNIPMSVIKECYRSIMGAYTPYDETIAEIIDKVYELNNMKWDGYVIGCPNIKGETFNHEVCHGKYYTNIEYRETANRLIKTKIEPEDLALFRKNLTGMGYAKKVINDEIQAYIQYGFENNSFGFGVPMWWRRKYNKEFDILKRIS